MGFINYIEERQPLKERIRIAKDNCDYLEPNCFGTGFFLYGILPFDQIIFTHNDYRYVLEALSLMNVHSKPVDNSIAASFDSKGFPCHVSYIERADPFHGYHRQGVSYPLEEIHSMNDIKQYLWFIDEYYNGIHTKRKYDHKFYTLENLKILEPWAKKMVKSYTPDWCGGD